MVRMLVHEMWVSQLELGDGKVMVKVHPVLGLLGTPSSLCGLQVGISCAQWPPAQHCTCRGEMRSPGAISAHAVVWGARTLTYGAGPLRLDEPNSAVCPAVSYRSPSAQDSCLSSDMQVACQVRAIRP